MFADMIEVTSKGDNTYPRALVAAATFWHDFHAQHVNDSPANLKAALEKQQLPFQWHLENEAGMLKPFSQSILAVTAIAALYDDGLQNIAYARRILDSIDDSEMGLGVKAGVKHARYVYNLP